MVREGVQAAELLVDGLGESEGVELRLERRELDDLRWIRRGAGLDALERGLGAVVHAADARADAHFAHELDRGQEQVLEQAQLLAIERVHGGHTASGEA